MKLANAHMVARIATARDNLVFQRNHAKIGVTLDGTYQDGAMVELVRPVVIAELDRRIADLDADLQALGVEVEVESA